jgi:hypothetical protein
MNGIHWAEGDIAFLIQGEQIQNALGINLDCPFPAGKGQCGHRINLQNTTDLAFPEHPLVDIMSPVPAQLPEPAFIAGDVRLLIATLARMSSPVQLPMRPFWAPRPKEIITALSQTNVQTLILTDVRPTDRKKLDQVLEAAPSMPRKLLLTGSKDVILGRGANRLTAPDWDMEHIVSLPWEAYGATLLKQYMLGMKS